jgi:hypothetical protein
VIVDTPAILADRLKSEGEKVVAFFQSLTPPQWEYSIYLEGSGWSVRDVLAHFVSAEIGNSELIGNIVSGGSGAPEGFDIDVYNEKQVAALQNELPVRLLEMFVRARSRTIQQVMQMSQNDLERIGRNPFLGEVPLVEIVKLIYRHNQIHLRDLKRLLKE